MVGLTEVLSTTWTVGFTVFAVCESFVAAVRVYFNTFMQPRVRGSYAKGVTVALKVILSCGLPFGKLQQEPLGSSVF